MKENEWHMLSFRLRLHKTTYAKRLFAFFLGSLMSFVSLATPADLSVAKFCELSVARLQLAEKSWRTADRPPSSDEEEALLQSFGTTKKDFLTFSSARAQEVAQYLDGNPAMKAEINRLSGQISEIIQKRSFP
jgi:hypothetical protein